MPYLEPGRKASNYAIWRWAQEGPPRPLSAAGLDLPDERGAICGRARERTPESRDATVSELAEDLRDHHYATVAIVRDGKTHIPRGDSKILAGDQLYMLSPTGEIEDIALDGSSSSAESDFKSDAKSDAKPDASR